MILIIVEYCDLIIINNVNVSCVLLWSFHFGGITMSLVTLLVMPLTLFYYSILHFRPKWMLCHLVEVFDILLKDFWIEIKLFYKLPIFYFCGLSSTLFFVIVYYGVTSSRYHISYFDDITFIHYLWSVAFASSGEEIMLWMEKVAW